MSGGHDKQWAAKSSMSRFGTFSTPSFAGVGEPYEDAQFSTPLPMPHAYHTLHARLDSRAAFPLLRVQRATRARAAGSSPSTSRSRG